MVLGVKKTQYLPALPGQKVAYTAQDVRAFTTSTKEALSDLQATLQRMGKGKLTDCRLQKVLQLSGHLFNVKNPSASKTKLADKVQEAHLSCLKEQRVGRSCFALRTTTVDHLMQLHRKKGVKRTLIKVKLFILCFGWFRDVKGFCLPLKFEQMILCCKADKQQPIRDAIQDVQTPGTITEPLAKLPPDNPLFTAINGYAKAPDNGNTFLDAICSHAKEKKLLNGTNITWGTPLILALRYKDGRMTPVIDALLDAKPDVTLTSCQGDTPLHWAICHYPQCIDKILALKPNLNVKNCKGFTPLDLAFNTKNKDLILKLLKAGAKVPEKLYNGYSPLLFAADLNAPDLIAELYKRGARPNVDDLCTLLSFSHIGVDTVVAYLQKKQVVHTTDKYKKSPIFLAIETNMNIAIIQSLLKHCSNLNARSGVTNSTVLEYALFCFSSRGVSKETVLEVIKHRPGDTIMNPFGQTSFDLVYALRSKDRDVVEALLKAGACPKKTIPFNGMSPLHYAQTLWESDPTNYQEVYSAMARALNVKNPPTAPIKPPIFDAIERGEDLGALLTKEDKWHHSMWQGQTPLHFAIYQRNEEAIKALIKHGHPLNKKNYKGETALKVAFMDYYGFPETIVALLEAGATIPKQIDHRTPLRLAANAKFISVIHALYKRGVAPEIQVIWDLLNLKITDPKEIEVACALLAKKQPLITSKYSLIHWSIKDHQSLDVIEAMLPHISNIDAKWEGQPPLHLALELDRLDVAQKILVYRPNVNKRDSKGFPPLYYAIVRIQPELVEKLLQAGADPYCFIPALNLSLLEFARNLNDEKGFFDQVLSILQGHINKPTITPVEKPPIFTAIENSDLPALQRCLKDHPKWQKLYWQGATPLHFALSNPDLLDALLQAKPNFSVPDLSEDSALHLAIRVNHADAVEKLLKAGHPLDCRDFKGNTPLMIALQDHEAFVTKLLKHPSVDVHTPNHEGETPLLLAIQSKNVEWVSTIAAKKPSLKRKEREPSYLTLALQTKSPEIVSAIASLKPKLSHKEMEEATHYDASKKCLRTLLRHYTTLPLTHLGEHFAHARSAKFRPIFFEYGHSLFIKDKQGTTLLQKNTFDAYATLLSSSRFKTNTLLSNGFPLLDSLILSYDNCDWPKEKKLAAIQDALERGADPTLKAPANGLTAYQLVESLHNDDLSQLFKYHRATH